MEQTIEPTQATAAAPRVGIIERLKKAETIEAIADVLKTFETYKHASAKTTRRFQRVLKSKSELSKAAIEAIAAERGETL